MEFRDTCKFWKWTQNYSIELYIKLQFIKHIVLASMMDGNEHHIFYEYTIFFSFFFSTAPRNPNRKRGEMKIGIQE